MREIEIELKNVVAAWKWSVDRGSIASLAQTARGDLPTSANALWVIGQVALAEGFYEESRQRLKECITNYRAGWQHDWRNRRGNALTILACADCYEGFLAQARDHLRQA